MDSAATPLAQAVDASASAWQPHIIAFVCHWCTYAGADMAGTTRRIYPPNVRILRFPCTGRMSPLFILRAFEQGADGVLVSGCHPGDCHYVQGNYFARRRFAVFRALLEFLGVDPRRLQFSWVSASEGVKWARVVEEVTQGVRDAGPISPWGRVQDHGRLALVRFASPADQAGRRPGEDERAPVLAELRRAASELLSSGRISRLIGYGESSLPGKIVPVFLDNVADASVLAWTDGCSANLAAYLPAAMRSGKVGIIVKSCDSKAVVGLLQENQIRREDVVLIGVPCTGVRVNGRLASKCFNCDGQVSPLCDLSAGGARPAAAAMGVQVAVPPDVRDADVGYIESLPLLDRWNFWQNQFARCLRCYACRAVCPLCYCETCIAEKHRPQWISTSIDGKGNTAWNVVRAFHLAGRCIGCDECSRVCPANIRLDLLNRRLAIEVERRFGYRAGQDAVASPPLASFRQDDSEEFIR
ncbi:MAG: hydrogenase iron-sulfur subunit [Acidobacteriota bacterium]